jgi:hypothetical protein
MDHLQAELDEQTESSRILQEVRVCIRNESCVCVCVYDEYICLCVCIHSYTNHLFGDFSPSVCECECVYVY